MRIIHSVAAAAGAVLLAAAAPAYAQKFDGLAQTPPMGWNSWNHFGCNIDETLIRETADAMVESGMKAAGYEYVNIDDCWHGERDKDGFIQPHPERFPSGMKALADYVHKKGLKLGIYSDAGSKTCAGRPGSQGYEYQDALQYARWGIDYLKYDWCNTGSRDPVEAYTTMRDALYAAGRPVVYSICEWGENEPWKWAADIGHLWRTTGDIINCWECEVRHGNWSSWGIMNILDMQEGGPNGGSDKLRTISGPGRWNDPDMMEVGNLPSEGENRAHFTMWAMLAAPLIVGTDIRELAPEIREILTNKDVIAVDQDKLGIQGLAYRRTASVEYWVKPLKGGDWAFVALNRSDAPQEIEFDWSEHPIGDNFNNLSADFANNTYALRDLWRNAEMGTTQTPLKARVPARDVLMLRLSKK